MAKYKLTAAAIIDDVQRDPGFEFEFDGVPGPHMEPLDDAAKRAVAERDKAKQPEIGLTGNIMQAHPTEVTRPTVESAHRAEAKPEEKKPDEDDHRAGPGGHRRG